ncbi:MAG: monofunctional biosynthetic peptidoglycan transglycosylase [Bacteroidales bacterium]|jgi:monofunctional biosynthetic peptidoglycan transglycosylase
MAQDSHSFHATWLLLRFRHYLKVSVLCFIGLSFYFTICFSFIHPQRTPLMVKRYVEYKKEKREVPFRHQWVPIEEISPHLIRAVVAAEDNRFTKHYGIDFGAIRKARDYNKRSTHRKRGASTISQQTAKNIFLWPARTYIRKGFEVYFTLLIETFWSKRRIMEVYLNMIEMGAGIYGAEAASQYYFHKPASRLTGEEAALIAISLPNPQKRNPAKPTSYMLWRQKNILSLMRKIGEIDL